MEKDKKHGITIQLNMKVHLLKPKRLEKEDLNLMVITMKETLSTDSLKDKANTILQILVKSIRESSIRIT